MTSSFTEIHALAGKPAYPLNEGLAPSERMYRSIAASISAVVMPGLTSFPPTISAFFVILPASRINSISAGDFIFIIVIYPGSRIPSP